MSFKIIDRGTGETIMATRDKPKAIETAKSYLKKGHRIIVLSIESGIRKQVLFF